MLVQYDSNKLPEKHRKALYLTGNSAYLLVLDADGGERERLIIRGNEAKRSEEESERFFSVSAVGSALRRATKPTARGYRELALLVHLLGHSDPRVRIDAVRHVRKPLAKYADTIVPALVPNLTDTDDHPSLGGAAAWALGQMGTASAPALPRMLALLQSSDTSAGLARDLLEVLGKLDPEGQQILGVLRHHLGRDVAHQNGASDAARDLGPRAKSLVPEITKVLTHGRRRYVRVVAALTLAAVGSDAAVALPQLRELAGAAKPDARPDWEDLPAAAAHAVKVIEAAVAGADQ